MDYSEFNKMPKYKTWTNASIFCYKRHCKCEGCYIKDILETPCMMKMSVITLVKKYGVPKEETGLTDAQQEIIDAILNGCSTFKEIANSIHKEEQKIKSLIVRMYELAEFDGIVYKNKRFKFPQFVKWVRGEYEG